MERRRPARRGARRHAARRPGTLRPGHALAAGVVRRAAPPRRPQHRVLPEYWRAHRDDLDEFGAPGLDGFEVVDWAPQAPALPARRPGPAGGPRGGAPPAG